MTTTKTKPAVKKVQKPLPKLEPNPFMFEVFDLSCKQRTRAKKIEVLQEYKHDSIISIFLWNFVPSLESALPPGEVPYAALRELNLGNDTMSETVAKQVNSAQPVDSYGANQRTTLRNEFSIFYNFLKGGNDRLSNVRRETMFINLLEGLHPREAQILILTKDKKLTSLYPFTFDLVREAYPEVKWDR